MIPEFDKPAHTNTMPLLPKLPPPKAKKVPSDKWEVEVHSPKNGVIVLHTVEKNIESGEITEQAQYRSIKRSETAGS